MGRFALRGRMLTMHWRCVACWWSQVSSSSLLAGCQKWTTPIGEKGLVSFRRMSSGV